MDIMSKTSDPVKEASELVNIYAETPESQRPVVLAWLEGFLACNRSKESTEATT